MEALDCLPAKFSAARGLSKNLFGQRITRGICDALPEQISRETGSGRRTIQRHIARRGGLFALSFIVGGGGPGGGSIWLRFWLEFRVVPRLRAAIASRDSSPAKSCPGRLGHSEFPLLVATRGRRRVEQRRIIINKILKKKASAEN
ncbi:hypothetical protein THAOC_18302 [Thalassiosira oceanica]|uniref:Uncharacterized protein n=1 Tax=Thalassiosira oceanica TaxID=159749 RepID=K0S8L3_THAOC|nr:hypothetical protein THAOC_18302 [Thalassiosira oceanica]|eukprot:EJK61249.1 hypothetical protein THAOC_18302 [Thalassiosira oceanica]